MKLRVLFLSLIAAGALLLVAGPHQSNRPAYQPAVATTPTPTSTPTLTPTLVPSASPTPTGTPAATPSPSPFPSSLVQPTPPGAATLAPEPTPAPAATVQLNGAACSTSVGGAAVPLTANGYNSGKYRWFEFCSDGSIKTGRTQELTN
jgi:hypothetical protein